MPDSVLDTLETHFSDIVASFQGTFDTHDFIRRLAHRHQHAYIAALVSFQEQPHPFNTLHGQIGLRLGQRSDLVQKVGRHDSEDTFGQRNSAVIWRQVS